MAPSYEETLEFLFSRLPVFQRVGAAAYKPGLDNILHFCDLLGNPQNKFRTVHIAGTNGKGSTSHSLASVLQEAGYKTGLYTSPHLRDFRERIRINGEMILRERVTEKVYQWRPWIDRIQPSFFELTVALAFDYFAENQVDIAIVEVGMGGRLDSTNIIRPLVSVITNIGLDHQKFLGNTLSEIAAEKAGIIKTEIPVVIGERTPATEAVFVSKTSDCHSVLTFAEDCYEVADLGISDGYRLAEAENRESGEKLKLKLSLLGDYQLRNLKGILTTTDLLRHQQFAIPDAAVSRGIARVQENTGLIGRWQILQENPRVICDTGHNEDGIKMVMQQMKDLIYRKLWMVWGMVNDKDHANILRLLPREAIYLITEPRIPRAMPKEALNALFVENGLNTRIFDSVSDALNFALQEADKEDVVFIGGSTFTVADIPFEIF